MLTDLEIKCLWAISDDYEEVLQIMEMLKTLMETDASAGDISFGLHKLVISKLAQAYEYDESKEDFIEVDFSCEKARLPSAMHPWRLGESNISRVWFYITQAGKDLLKGQTSPCRQD